ncbi:MAG: hypothetical protein M0C28_11165 [Candidatus Moduliflexus flocculans]|nr:hypothetical protein [Candidatus Moduliflexus flocculans]
MGYMTAPWDPTLAAWLDVHGAGAQRSDPKEGQSRGLPPRSRRPRAMPSASTTTFAWCGMCGRLSHR